MAVPELVEYVKNRLAAGWTEADIRENLLEYGWTESQILDAIKEVKSAKPEQPKEEVKEKKIISFGAILGFGAGLFIFLGFIMPYLAGLPSFSIFEIPIIGQYLSALIGLIMIIAALLANKTRFFGALILIFSILYLLTGGNILVFVIALIASVLAIAKR
ncbi:MAG: hypothetical protein QW703_00630 [Candidatus Aenigmatarchaeota archaeon]